MEKTLVVFKPDALQRGVCGEILARFEKRGFKIVGMKMMQPEREFFYKHYETIGTMISRRGEEAFNLNLEAMQKGPVIAIALEGVGVVQAVRQMAGTTEPAHATPGTIRGDYAHMTFAYADQEKKGVPNLIHASGNLEEAQQELALWFGNEFFSYARVEEKFLY